MQKLTKVEAVLSIKLKHHLRVFLKLVYKLVFFYDNTGSHFGFYLRINI